MGAHRRYEHESALGRLPEERDPPVDALTRALARRLERRDVLRLLVVAPLVGLAACAPRGPEPIRYGEAICPHCQMMISDNRYGAQLITRQGRVHSFDSIECMVAYAIRNALMDTDLRGRYVTDFERPGTLMPAEEAVYLQSPELRSPMSVNITAFASESARDAAHRTFGGAPLSFADLERVVREARFV
jgi:copper chaperone NosL